MKYIKRSQSGFTLVEIAIVLVIIGLLLGGVLKGQEMIENAKIKNAINDINGVSAAYNAYIDRFKALPGDDGGSLGTLASLRARGGAWANVTTNGNNNGVILIAATEVFAPVTESLSFWQSLKAAGFIAGNPADTGTNASPRNAFNGLVGVGPGVGAGIFSVCLGQVPGKSARAMDLQFDDGISDRGSFLATVGVIGTNTTPGAAAVSPANYTDAGQYTTCKTL